MSVFLA